MKKLGKLLTMLLALVMLINTNLIAFATNTTNTVYPIRLKDGNGSFS